MFCAVGNSARGVSEICDGVDLWHCTWQKIRLNSFNVGQQKNNSSSKSSSFTSPFIFINTFLIKWMTQLFPYNVFTRTEFLIHISIHDSFLQCNTGGTFSSHWLSFFRLQRRVWFPIIGDHILVPEWLPQIEKLCSKTKQLLSIKMEFWYHKRIPCRLIPCFH